MAKSKINHKVTTTNQFTCEGILDVDKLPPGVLLIEVEDEGVVDLKTYFDKFNSDTAKIVITNKVEELPEE